MVGKILGAQREICRERESGSVEREVRMEAGGGLNKGGGGGRVGTLAK